MSDTDRPFEPLRGRELRWRIWQQLPLRIILVVLWMMLWGEISWLSFLSGVLIAVVVPQLFYLPPVDLPGRLNPFYLIAFLAVFLIQVAVSSIQVAVLAFGPRVDRNAIVAVSLRTSSDFILTMTAIVTSLVPGSFIADIDRERTILYVHFIGKKDADAVERARRGVLATERRLVRALGSRADLERIRS